MAELFTHVLAGYILATALSWRFTWITPPLVTVAMVGAALPDLNRIGLLVDAALIESMLGIPFSWTPLHRIGGTVLVIALGTLLVPSRLRKAVAIMLILGAGSHYLLDLFLYQPSGLAGPMFWPLTGERIAIPGFYLSSDRWTAAVAIIIAGIVFAIDRYYFPPERRP